MIKSLSVTSYPVLNVSNASNVSNALNASVAAMVTMVAIVSMVTIFFKPSHPFTQNPNPLIYLSIH
jgi:hypothetical protein